MCNGVQLGVIPEAAYAEYRYEVIFKAYKWDPQVGDSNTVARHVVLMGRETAERLGRWAEALSEETMLMEEALMGQPRLWGELGFPKKTFRALGTLSGYERRNHVRLMRFDFHPILASCPTQETECLRRQFPATDKNVCDTFRMDGWNISEVNSDVPGGLAEASVLPTIAARWFDGVAPHRNVVEALLAAFRGRVAPGGTMALVHATAYSDDRQVMQCLGDAFEGGGYRAVYAAPDHIAWDGKRAVGADGIVRFFPGEWLENLPRQSGWTGYFDTATPSCNHPVALFAQSKRLPLVWDKLGVDIPTWKSLLPETADPTAYGSRGRSPSTPWILKPALGRVGEGITIGGVMPDKEIRLAEKAARRHPEAWVAQRLFHSQPLVTENGEPCHLCIGAFTVDGKSAGFYGRVSPAPRMDANAKDIPVLVEG
ncbi:MAG: glutathionylspermidine synthase family protein [Kiritimatiellaeota bacterium]|nr:glutathionylspermidine synthase family protein [Kiritimatiellota bacterium]